MTGGKASGRFLQRYSATYWIDFLQLSMNSNDTWSLSYHGRRASLHQCKPAAGISNLEMANQVTQL